ncbi:methyltransferase domain-containing protein [Deinococcus roseus]|uniref:RNA methyltransferase n=1 Tax=Deinococcus roseus TaxID=392414 RepID=A0ABQ2CYW8_9DEIO|nr:methyltransferase domain-containing protein [Deinococcus roseus]GGJ34108.1 RNA methyltransferase [Deinococcus roseus]
MQTYQLDLLEGLTPFVLNELKPLNARILTKGKDFLRIAFPGKPLPLLQLRTVVAVSRIEQFEVPRPKALLGHQHLTRLLSIIQDTQKLGVFSSFRFAAAGSDSSVFQRLAEEISKQSKLKHDPEEGELVLRFLKAGAGWEVLVRLSPRPLSARPWRVANMEGGLNATVASAMLQLAHIEKHDVVYNPMCGSGTLMIECGLIYGNRKVSGCDLDFEHVGFAQVNLQAAGLDFPVELADATHLDQPAQSVDVIVCDLPWGDNVGSNTGNLSLYPEFFREMTRIATPGARMVLISHEVKLMDRLVKGQTDWKLLREDRVYHGGHFPRIYTFNRSL